MAKLSDMSLDELYERPKITASALRVIHLKEDFSHVQARYCQRACAAPDHVKNPDSVSLDFTPRDILVVTRHGAMDDVWRSGNALDEVHNRILVYLLESEISALQKAGYRSKPSYGFLRAFKCRPVPTNRVERERVSRGERMPLPENPKITQRLVGICSAYLMEEIRQSRPKVILATCTISAKALGLKDANSTKKRGHVHHIEVDGRRIPVISTLHPEKLIMIRQNSSGEMWGPDYTGILRKDIQKALAIATDQFSVLDLEDAVQALKDAGQLFVPKTLEEVRLSCEQIKSLPGKTLISWDTETSGLDPWAEDARFLTHQFGYRRPDGRIQAVIIPLWHRSNTGYDPEAAWPYIRDILEDESIPKVAHNASFDLKYTRVTRGCVVRGLVADTLLLLHALNSGVQGNYSLKTAVWDELLHTGLGGYEDDLDIGEDADVEDVEEETHDE